MKRILIFLLLCMSVSTLSAQGFVKGKVLDKQNSEPLGFVAAGVTASPDASDNTSVFDVMVTVK